MKARKRLLTVALTAALGLGVWTLAISFTTASFGDGDILSAAQLNDLLNDNFAAVDTEFAAVNTVIADLGNDKFNKAGGTITGRTDISAAASSSGSGDVSTVFRVNNSSATEGSAAVFQSSNSSPNGAVSIKQQGAGPALTLKSNGGGPLISGAGSLLVTFIVEDNGSIKIGDMGANGSGDPTLHLNAVDGTITNNVGSGLPLAFGSVDSDGNKLGGTSNWVVSRHVSGTTYYIKLDGEGYNQDDYVAVATTRGSNNARSITSSMIGSGASGELALSPRNAAGERVSDGFFFVIYKPGS